MAASTTTTTCSRCGTDKTYVQNNCEKWYHDKDTKEKICKNCYSKSRTTKPIIDLTKVKPSEIKIDNSFVTTTTTADDTTDKILIDKKPVSIPRSDSVLLDKKKKQRKNFNDMSIEEKSTARKFFRKKYERNLNKKIKYIPAEQYFPYITDLIFYPSVNNGGNGGACRLCGDSLYYECGVKLIIPNFKIKKSFLPDNNNDEGPNLVLCKVCLKRLNKFCSASKISSDQDMSLRVKMLERQQRNKNANKCIPRDKTDNRNYLEIRDEIEKETRKELSIPDDCMF